ncbi:MFS transporter [Nocardioides sp. Arc9.136]|uniref:MFS transporter n=1 Tax=Nocardioides sp. Arc9.136 TaxID=2996826 RepID=UPI0026661166|nr:MFS transporter [Nocardioides sp. Arc9.136]WKN48468.1 MFS transporter [Nocardioides sp. Arc9.136]
MDAVPQPPADAPAGPLAALRVPVFRLLVGVQLVNAVAVWVHVVSVQWMLTERGESATVVSLAPAAMAVPFLALALPVGVVVGFASRERLMAAAALASGVSAAAAAALAALDVDGAVPALLTVVVVGVALVVVGVAWQSLLPETVGRPLVSSAAVVDGAVFNLARALGPLLAGVGLGLRGPVVTFSVVAALFACCAGVLALVELRRPGRRAPRRPVLPAIRAALRFTRHSPWTTRLLLRMTMFGLPAAALWALVSIVVHDRLGLGSGSFGVMMALLGVGAVAATLLLGGLRRRLSVRAFAAVGSAAYALTLLAMGLATTAAVVAPFLVLGGVAWVGVQSTWMMLAHQALPDWVRPRVIALVLFLFQGTQAVGALLWGVAADLLGTSTALVLAAALMTASLGVLLSSGLGSSAGIEPVLADPDASVAALVADAGEGELVVRYEYVVAPARLPGFEAALADLRLSRLRLGGWSWRARVVDASADGLRWVETYRVAGREELLEQETVRLTVPEQRLRHAVRREAVRVAGPHVLLPTDPTADPADPADPTDPT